MFPQKDCVSHRLSPRTIVTGLEVYFKTYCRVPFGAYCEVHDKPKLSNIETSRTTPAIALIPTRNVQGGYFFMSLRTGKRLRRRKLTELLTTEEVIKQVHAFAINKNNSEEDNFYWDKENNQPIEPFDYRVHEPLLHAPEGANEEPNEDDLSLDNNDTEPNTDQELTIDKTDD